MPKVSVIVPAYNSSKTIVRCLAGLVMQTLDDIEIIVVNDCSTDDTLQILTDCEAKFPQRLMIINLSENLGAGGARNVGLEYASGEYIGFVDSDDEVVTTMYEKLYSAAAANNYDIVDSGYFNESEDNAMVHTSDELTGILDDHKRSELIASGGYMVTRIFRKSLIDRLNIHFRSHCILEDCEPLMLLTASAESIGNVKEILYCYHYYGTSTSQSTGEDSYFKNVASAVEAVYKTMSPLPNYDGIKEAVEYAIVNFCALITNIYRPELDSITDAGKTSGRAAAGAKDVSNAPTLRHNVRLERLRQTAGYMRDMVTIPLEKNRYVQNKISKQDISSLKKLTMINF